MRKLALDPDALVVESFAVPEEAPRPGTVRAHDGTLGPGCPESDFEVCVPQPETYSCAPDSDCGCGEPTAVHSCLCTFQIDCWP